MYKSLDSKEPFDNKNILSDPLLDAMNEQTDVMTKTNEGAESDYVHSGRIYANNLPRIVLETITARTATIIIVCTYFFFIFCFTLDFYTTFRSFSSSNFQIGSYSCSSQDLTISDTSPYWGCSSGNTWNSTVGDLHNVISTRLAVTNSNITENKVQNMNSSFAIRFNLQLWACYSSNGCGTDFATFDEYSNSPVIWQQVMVLGGQDITVSKSDDFVSLSNGVNELELPLYANTFQNQESIPTNGLVKSYFINVQYTEDPYQIFSNFESSSSSSVSVQDQAAVTYTFAVVSRPKQPAVYVATIILNIITIGILAGYVAMLWSEFEKALPEQKWIVAYFTFLILFQNPVYYTIVWYPANDGIIKASYAAYIIDMLAQSGLFSLWLLFADSVHRKTESKLGFYFPKIFFGVLIFSIGLSVLTFQFPTLDPSTSHSRSPVQSVVNWSHQSQLDFISLSILYLILLWIWTLVWFALLYLTGRKLRKLPYMSTRYIQLSYRFFLIQASLVTLYYVLQYSVVIYLLSNGTGNESRDVSTITDNINTLFRQQSELFGKTLFLTVYAVVLAFLFMPAELLDTSNGVNAILASTYVITEDEYHRVVKARKVLLRGIRKNFVNQLVMVKQFVNIKSDVFCVETALIMRTMSFEAYHDPPGLTTASGYEGAMSLAKVGVSVVDMHYNKEHEVFCIIVREERTGRIIVAFRGTAHKRQMEDNFNYTQRYVDWNALPTAADHFDGLDVPASAQQQHRGFFSDEFLGHGFGIEEEDDDDDGDDDDEGNEGNEENDEAGAAAGGKGARNKISEETRIQQRNILSFLQRKFSINSSGTGGGGSSSSSNKKNNSSSSSNPMAPKPDSIGIGDQHLEGGGEGDETSYAGDSWDQNDQNRPEQNRNTLIGTAGGGVKRVVVGAVDLTNTGINTVVGATTGVVRTAASHTPGLKTIVQPMIHCGFWEAYFVVREFLHVVLRRELLKDPTAEVYFTGHSLGGALATFAALDFSIHTVRRVNNFIRFRASSAQRKPGQDSSSPVKNSFFSAISRPFRPRNPAGASSTAITPPLSPTLLAAGGVGDTIAEEAEEKEEDEEGKRLEGGGELSPRISTSSSVDQRSSRNSNSQSYSQAHSESHSNSLSSRSRSHAQHPQRLQHAPKLTLVKRSKVFMYSFGSPKVGNGSFVQMYNQAVPNSYRVVVDGDLVAGLPPSRYAHVGTEVLIDGEGAGSCIIDPSFVERWLRTHLKSSVALHSLLVYRKGLLGLKLAAEFMARYADDFRHLDPLRVALNTGPMITQQVDRLLQSEAAAATVTAGADHLITVDTVEQKMVAETKREKMQANELQNKMEGEDGEMEKKGGEGIQEHSAQKQGDLGESKDNHEMSESDVDAKHYASDLENTNNLMDQFRVQGTQNPLNWIQRASFAFLPTMKSANASGAHGGPDRFSVSGTNTGTGSSNSSASMVGGARAREGVREGGGVADGNRDRDRDGWDEQEEEGEEDSDTKDIIINKIHDDTTL